VYDALRKQSDLLSASTQKAFCGSRQGTFDSTDEEVLEFVLEEYRNGLPIARQNMNEAIGICSSLKVVQAGFKSPQLVAGQSDFCI
jgi:hypothetical protein